MTHDGRPCQTALVEKKREASADRERQAVMAHVFKEAGARRARVQDLVPPTPPPPSTPVFGLARWH
jgi:hypothetical protein